MILLSLLNYTASLARIADSKAERSNHVPFALCVCSPEKFAAGQRQPFKEIGSANIGELCILMAMNDGVVNRA